MATTGATLADWRVQHNGHEPVGGADAGLGDIKNQGYALGIDMMDKTVQQ